MPGSRPHDGWQIIALEVMPDPRALVREGSSDRLPVECRQPVKERTSLVWSRSHFVATVGAVSASAVQRYIDTQYERHRRKEHEK